MATAETRRQLLAAVAACEDKKGEDTRILELDPADSGLADFFLITSATNDRQVVAIADEIEFRLKKEFGLYATSVEGRRQAEWILLDYVDIVIHVFLAEKRAFYDIERLRKSARNLSGAEVEAELKSALAKKTLAVRKSAPAVQASKASAVAAKSAKGELSVSAKPAKKAVKKALAAPAKTATKPAAVKKAAATKAPAKKAAAKAVPVKATAVKKAPAKKAVATKAVATKAPAKKAVAKKAAAKKTAAKKAPAKAAKKAAPVAVGVVAPTDPESRISSGGFGMKDPIIEKAEAPTEGAVAPSPAPEATMGAEKAPAKKAAKKSKS